MTSAFLLTAAGVSAQPAPAAPPPAVPPPAAPPAAAPAPTPAAPPPAAAPAPAPAPAPPAPAAAAPAAPALEAAPPLATEPAGTPTSAPDAAPLPEAAAEEKKEAFTITTGVGIRFGMQFQDVRDPKKLGMLTVDELYAEPRFSGKVLDFVGWTLNFAVEGRTPTTGGSGPVAFEAKAMDVVAQLDFMDEFHLWGGRMLTPSDRTNFSGPWFIGPWDYPGLYFVGSNGFYVGPRGTEEIGREVGATVWGDIGKGKFKYYLAMMDLDNANDTTNDDGSVTRGNTPLYSARLAYAFLGDEPGFYGSSTYYGSKEAVLVLGAAAQYQKRYTAGAFTDDLFEFNADLLAEFNVGTAGTVSLEGAYYHVDSGDSQGVMPYDDAFFVVASYLLPAMGPGRLQPLFRYQGVGNDSKGPVHTDASIVEGQVNYVLKDWFAKLSLGFAHTKLNEGVEGNQVQFGFQIQQ